MISLPAIATAIASESWLNEVEILLSEGAMGR